MNNCLIIIPLHKFDENIKNLLEKAINSVPANLMIRISTVKNIAKDNNFVDFRNNHKNLEVVYDGENNTDTSFTTLVNQAVDTEYEWFSILEFDDVYTPIWFDNVAKYIDYNQDYDIILPFVDILDFNTNKYVGMGNEAPWASSFSNIIGYIDLDSIKDYFTFFPTGGVFKTSTWLELGGLKKMDISFWYELFMRYCNNSKNIFIIPKIGYIHYINREDSLMKFYEDNMTNDDAKEAFKTAKKNSKTIIKPKYSIVKE